ncbi:hypothetical protein [Periweissella ghanensis]|uniref:Uncharacterized protein n=1 Tax=Periweissella ghanensis TaxID=467997 RepID=A0ABM8ZEX0_9LACO|nr:hypothetical protein [Periweissella ghanensis]MCM0601407.1 hypothetical protein [Periweissella ghanensis]CAH0419467.1 hypothetical protein WGH24286_01926 [Periweissella ghanensis]
MFNILKAIFKLVAALTLVISGIFIGGTIFTAKKIDAAGDKLQETIHN